MDVCQATVPGHTVAHFCDRPHLLSLSFPLIFHLTTSFICYRHSKGVGNDHIKKLTTLSHEIPSL